MSSARVLLLVLKVGKSSDDVVERSDHGTKRPDSELSHASA